MGRWFPQFYDLLMQPLERRKLSEVRANLVNRGSGKLLELGSGSGINFPLYQGYEEVTAIEPNKLMRERSLKKIEQANVPITLVAASAEELPFADNTFDTVVGTLVLCTIPNPQKALKEIQRVCKPDGRVLFLEHVRLTNKILATLQDFLTPSWKKLCDGCHLNRDSLGIIRSSGLQIQRVQGFAGALFLTIEAKNNSSKILNRGGKDGFPN